MTPKKRTGNPGSQYPIPDYNDPFGMKVYDRYATMQNTDYTYVGGVRGDDPFLIENLNTLRICRVCFHLYGDIWLGDGTPVQQKCGCKYDHKDEWPHFDYCTAYETCYCCGLEIINSGSKWSLFYCKTCKELIWDLKKKTNRGILPFGRHSMMNGVHLNLKKEEPLADDPIDSFFNGLQGMFASIKSVRQHRELILKQRVKELRLSKNASAMDFLKKTFDLPLYELKEASFYGLLAFAWKMKAEEVKEILEKMGVNK